ncbi:MAG: DUF927 domain-containing protein [Lachnospiraceae bacterium]|nr:DUF927 domain-containing protein [Lachnospiraceae bacterium]
MDLTTLNEKTVLSDEVFEEIFSQEDEIYKARLLLAAQEVAERFRVKGKFDQMVRAYKRVDRETRKKKKQQTATMHNYTEFEGPYQNLYCGSWIAGETGIYAPNMGVAEQTACYHPILPIERLKNLETGEEQIKLAYKRNQKWDEIIVPKTMVTSAGKIVALSGRGIAVTSETAKLLVRYLSDVENLNEDAVKVQYSSSKLGWMKHGFLPYDTEILFDGNRRFCQIYDSMKEQGSRERWFGLVKELRKRGRMEVKFMLAASFSSVLVHVLGGLPYVVDLWGETEGGKTITLMLAASVWANPDESVYMGDFKTTDVALEAKADLLNHLPLIIDDTSKTSARIRENFEGVVYDLCSGKGKSRSNKELGIHRENRWRNAILTNGERPLVSYVAQGGAVNRILEIECGEKVYQEPQRTAEIIKKNYGFAGKEFVKAIEEMGEDAVREIQEKYQEQLYDEEKMQKQSLSLAIILTADQIATDTLFQDGQYISIEEAKKVLIDRSELSDNERCYRYILDKVAMNGMKFDGTTNCEKWGIIEHDYVIFYNQAFDELCKSGGFSKKSFLSWAVRKRIVQTDSKGNPTKQKKIDGKNNRCVWLRLDHEVSVDKDGFMSVDYGVQEGLPFE